MPADLLDYALKYQELIEKIMLYGSFCISSGLFLYYSLSALGERQGWFKRKERSDDSRLERNITIST